jgi:hypothetical protein
LVPGANNGGPSAISTEFACLQELLAKRSLHRESLACRLAESQLENTTLSAAAASARVDADLRTPVSCWPASTRSRQTSNSRFVVVRLDALRSVHSHGQQNRWKARKSAAAMLDEVLVEFRKLQPGETVFVLEAAR